MSPTGKGLVRKAFGSHGAAIAVFGALLAALVIAVPIVTILVQGEWAYARLSRSYPGVVTSLTTVVLTAVASLSAIACLGCLTVAVFLRPGHDRVVHPEGYRLVRWAGFAAMTWFAAAVGLVVFTAADNNGVPAGRMLPVLADFLSATQAAQAWIVVAAGALVVCIGCWATVSWRTCALLWAVAVAITLPPVVTGQVSVGNGHDFGTDAAVIGAVVRGVWFAGTVALAAHLLVGGKIEPASWRRYGLLEGLAIPVSLLAHGVVVVFLLAGRSSLSSPTGMFAVAEFAILLAIAGLAIARRRRGERHAIRFLVAETVTIGLFTALAEAGTRIAPPRFFLEQTIQENFLGYSVDAAPSLAALVGPGRGNLLFGALAVVAAGGYLLGVRRLWKRGDRWPPGRTLSWLSGWAVVVYVTTGGLGTYSPAAFSLHMIVHMSLSMAAPILLVLGGPLTLALRAWKAAGGGSAWGPREWLTDLMASWPARLLTHPLLVFAVYTGSYYGLYFTELFGTLMRFHWAHQLMSLHFLGTGFLFFWLVVGVDRAPRQLPHIARLGLAFAAMPFHAFFAVAVMSSGAVIGSNFYRSLDVAWMRDLLADQHLGGGIAWAAGELPLLLVVIALFVSWSREDDRAATRTDRAQDTGLSDELAAYNQMLARLSGSERAQCSSKSVE